MRGLLWAQGQAGRKGSGAGFAAPSSRRRRRRPRRWGPLFLQKPPGWGGGQVHLCGPGVWPGLRRCPGAGGRGAHEASGRCFPAFQAIESFALMVKQTAQMLQAFGTELAETELPNDVQSTSSVLCAHTEKKDRAKVRLRAGRGAPGKTEPRRPQVRSRPLAPGGRRGVGG